MLCPPFVHTRPLALLLPCRPRPDGSGPFFGRTCSSSPPRLARCRHLLQVGATPVQAARPAMHTSIYNT